MGVLGEGEGTYKKPQIRYLDCLVHVIDPLNVIAEEDFIFNKIESTPTNLLLIHPFLFKKLG